MTEKMSHENMNEFAVEADFRECRAIEVSVEELIPGIAKGEGLIRDTDYHAWHSEQAEILTTRLSYRPETIKVFNDFQDQIVVDIGAGDLSLGYQIICLAEAKSYIGVEPFYANDLRDEIKTSGGRLMGRDNDIKLNNIPYAIVEQDALSFLRRLPQNSVSIFSSGLDHTVIINSEYKRMVEKEIERVLHSNGAFINHNSVFSLDENSFSKDLNDSQSFTLPVKVFKRN